MVDISFFTHLNLFSRRDSVLKEEFMLSKISIREDDEVLEKLKEIYETDNLSHAIRLAIGEALVRDNNEKIKTLFPYIGKKPLRIGREVVEAFRQSECDVFVDVFCGSLAMICYLPYDTKVVVNDIDGNLTNLYEVINTKPDEFVKELLKIPYSEVLFEKFRDDIRNNTFETKLQRAVEYYFLRFCTYRGSNDFTTFKNSTTSDNYAMRFQKDMKMVLALSKRLQTVEILNRDFRRVLEQFNKPNIFIYADCPYLGTEKYYKNIFSDEDHRDLSKMLKAHKGKFALSSKAKGELRKLYRSNRHYMLEFEATAKMPDKRRREQLIFNFKMIHKNKFGEDDIKTYR